MVKHAQFFWNYFKLTQFSFVFNLIYIPFTCKKINKKYLRVEFRNITRSFEVKESYIRFDAFHMNGILREMDKLDINIRELLNALDNKIITL